MSTDKHGGWKLLAIILIFLVPVVFAFVLYYGFSYRGGEGTNNGELVTPARPLPELTLSHEHDRGSVSSTRVLKGKWTLLEVAPDGCRQACRQSLAATRQVRSLLHDDIARVQRVLLIGANQRFPQLHAQPDLQVYRTHLRPLIQLFTPVGASAPGVVYVVDPLGNWMLYYPSRATGDGLFEDIKHLLMLSHIG